MSFHPQAHETSACLMWATGTDGAICELVLFVDGSLGVLRNGIPVGSPRFPFDQLTQGIELLYRISGLTPARDFRNKTGTSSHTSPTCSQTPRK